MRSTDDELQALLVIELAEAEAGESGFAAHALRQLAARRDLHGHRPTTPTGLGRLIDKLGDITANLGCRAAFGLGRLGREHADGRSRSSTSSGPACTRSFSGSPSPIPRCRSQASHLLALDPAARGQR
jgi:hypothetical protein